MNAFVTRYRPLHGEDELKKHIEAWFLLFFVDTVHGFLIPINRESSFVISLSFRSSILFHSLVCLVSVPVPVTCSFYKLVSPVFFSVKESATASEVIE